MSNIFELKNVDCQYQSNSAPVLKIKKLDIEKGSKTFFIGPSGVGKSTILETLGMMNNTMQSNSDKDLVANFIDPLSGGKISLMNLWNRSENNISDFRSKHLSFIFQSTNLFKNLSAFDNVSISAILQGQSKNEAVNRTKNIIKSILPDVPADKPIMELSGGQRQRIAFARAMVSDFSVLFADEPTGNLDGGNAKNLMDVLLNNLASKTAVVVTHDIELAILYATKIVFIRRHQGLNSHGIIDENSVYKKESNGSWLVDNSFVSDNDLRKLISSNVIKN
mgnify:CR=1 FL=1|jgi:ABC-type lipoprotein export system ATPase subunit|tara:strand:- start:836 stop:1672 length:837 start_codon:yes stop_codon:yes gene_type:complete